MIAAATKKFFSELAVLKEFLPKQLRHIYSIYNSDRFFWLLAALFCIIFGPYVFIMLEDVNLLTALEVDPGSIIRSINDLYTWPFYNMFNGYHSQFYGWTFFAINFFTALPAKLLTVITGSHSQIAINLSIRTTLFIIGLLSISMTYITIDYIFKSRLFAFIGSLFLMISGISSLYYTFVHPETTGVFFSMAGLYCLLKFKDAEKTDQNGWYILGAACLIFASLSKQLFFFTSLPMLGLFCFFYAKENNYELGQFLKTKEFRQYFIFTSGLSLLLLALIHPYAMIQPNDLYKSQFSTLFDHTEGANTMSGKEAFIVWWQNIYERAPVFMMVFITAPLSLFWAFKKNSISKENRLLFLINTIGILLLTLMVTITARLFPGVITYLYPIYPFAIIYMIGLVRYIFSLPKGILRNIACVIAVYFMALSLGYGASQVMPDLKIRSNYKQTVTYQTFQYIKSAIPENSRIAIDHFVAAPEKIFKTCHYWNDCSTPEGIEKFHPDYIILNQEYEFNGKIAENTANLLAYLKQNSFILVKTLSGHVINGPQTTLSVYKREAN